ncbi:MAG: hypothetical protein RLZZ172_889 [Bacteroidota bacterium]
MSGIKGTYLYSVLNNKCPRCRQGDMFCSTNAYKLKEFTKMNETCAVCGQPTEIEVGFYYGTGYVSYALTVAFSVATFIAWWVIIGLSLDDNRFFWWMGTNAVLMILMQPLFMRLSRSIWLSWFVSYDKNWQNHPLETPERIIPIPENEG